MDFFARIPRLGLVFAAVLAGGLLGFGTAYGQQLPPLMPGEQRLFAPNLGFEPPGLQPGDRFGESIAMDGSWAVIGAPGSSREGTRDDGAVAVLRLEEGNWSLVEKITPPGSPFAKRNFGIAVALDGDWLAIGGYEPAMGSPNYVVSQVYLYRLLEGRWTFHSQRSAVASNNPQAYHSPRAMGIAMKNGKLACHAQAFSLSFFTWNGSAWRPDQPLVLESLDVLSGSAIVHLGDAVLVGKPGSAGQVKEYRVNNSSGFWGVHRTINRPDGFVSTGFGQRLATHEGRVAVAASDRIFYYQHDESQWVLLGTVPIGEARSISLSATHLATGYDSIQRLFKIDAEPPENWQQTSVPMQASAQSGRISIVTSGGQTIIAGHNQLSPNPRLEVRCISGDDLANYSSLPVPRSAQRPEVQFAAVMAFSGSEAAFSSSSSVPTSPPFPGNVHLAEVTAQGQWQMVETLDGIDSSTPPSYGYQIALDSDWLAVSFEKPTGGKVALYRKAAGIWSSTPQATLESPNPQIGSVFGFRTALRGNFLAVEAFQESANTAVTYLYEISAEAEPILLDSSKLFLHRFDGDTLIGLTSPSAASSKLRFLHVQNQKLAVKRTLSKPSPFSLQQFRSAAFDVTEEAVVMTRQGRVAAWRRSGNKWLAMKLQTPIHGIVAGEMQSPGYRIEGNILLVTLQNRFSVFARTDHQWIQTMNHLAHFSIHPLRFAAAGGLSSDHVFVLSRDTQNAPTFLPYLSIFGLTEAKLLGPATDPFSTPTLEDTLHAGEMLVGQGSSIPLTIHNAGVRPLEISELNLDWVSVDSTPIQLPNLPVTVLPGQSRQITLQVTPTQVGDFEVNLTLVTQPELPAALQVRLLMTAVSERQTPTFVGGLQPRIVALDEPLWITPEIQATKPYTLQWLHNQKPIKGQTEPSLKINTLMPSHAGNYQLQISWPGGGVLSPEVPVAIFAPLSQDYDVKPSSPLSLRAKIWGDQVGLVWVQGNLGNAPLSDSWSLQGARSPILRGNRVDSLSGPFPHLVQAVASFRGLNRVIANYSFYLKDSFPQDPLPDHSRILRVGEDVVGIGDTIVSASGLPPGLRMSRNQDIVGIPTRVGRYRSSIRTALPHGKSWTGIHTFVVLPPVGEYFGRFGGYVGSGPITVEIPLPENAFTQGTLYAIAKVRISGNGAASGTLQVANHSRRFRLKMEPDVGDPNIRRAQVDLPSIPGTPSLRVTLAQNAVSTPDESDSWLTVDVWNPDRSENEGGSFKLAPLATPTREDKKFLSGRFNATMAMDEPPSYGPAFPTASGIFSGTLRGGKSLRYVLELPTGDKLTGASDLTDRDSGHGAAFMHYTGRHVLSGAVRWPKKQSHEEDGDPEMSGNLTWHLAPIAEAISYPSGFSNAFFSLNGAKHFSPLRGQPIFSNLTDASTNAVIVLDHPALNPSEEQALGLSFFMGPQNQLTLPSPQHGVKLQSLSLNLKTGCFTGTLEHQASAPGVAPSLVPISGVFIPGQNRGGGYFQLPSNTLEPTLESGSITILPHPAIEPPILD